MKKTTFENAELIKLNFQREDLPNFGRKKSSGIKKLMKNLFFTLLIFLILSTLFVVATNVYVRMKTSKYIVNTSNAPKSDCVLVLGAGVYNDGSLSHMLQDRIKTGVEASTASGTVKFLLSGDNGQVTYNEVIPMLKEITQTYSISPENVFLDHAGFSTYESMYRADYIFKVKKAIVITQEYHLPRALYVARSKGIDAYGVAADKRPYYGMGYYKLREYLATSKDFLFTLFNFDPTFKGPEIPITGDGTSTHNE